MLAGCGTQLLQIVQIHSFSKKIALHIIYFHKTDTINNTVLYIFLLPHLTGYCVKFMFLMLGIQIFSFNPKNITTKFQGSILKFVGEDRS